MNAIIVEDEVVAARNLQAILNEIGEVSVISTLETISETVEWFKANPNPELVFMDIHLADGSAFEIFERTKITCPVIFTTAYDEYALKAFKVNSIDYLLKPIEEDAVRKALLKFKTFMPWFNSQDELQKIISLLKTKMSYKTHFLVSIKGEKLIPLDVIDIAYIFTENNVVKVHTRIGNNYFLEYTLDELMNMLNPQEFFRANRQFIIARNAIKDMDLWFSNRLSVNLKVSVSDKILISKAKVGEFKTWFTGQ